MALDQQDVQMTSLLCVSLSLSGNPGSNGHATVRIVVLNRVTLRCAPRWRLDSNSSSWTGWMWAGKPPHSEPQFPQPGMGILVPGILQGYRGDLMYEDNTG